MHLKMKIERTIQSIYSGPDIKRLDQALVEALRNDYSRTFCQKLIKGRNVWVNGVIVERPCETIVPGAALQVAMPVQVENDQLLRLDHISNDGEQGLGHTLEVIYEHEHFAVINKPAGLLVHTAGTAPDEITLVDLLLKRFCLQNLDGTVRPGIVHRLDRDTSGLIVIVKNPQAQAIFAQLFHERSITKCYHAVVKGHPPREGELDWNIVRHPRNRLMMTHSRVVGREAYTRYRCLEYFEDTALFELFPKTGRTHQIRVHCSAMGHPLLGDVVYHEASPLIGRQALHATSLQFSYNGISYEFTAPYPQDMQTMITGLRVGLN
jgi:23S rRNA pseudouridine1911/1915/1917 synthase